MNDNIIAMSKLRNLKSSLSNNLKERVKELSCLYQISKIAHQSENESIDIILHKILLIIPQGWQYPESTAACLYLDNEVYGNTNTTDNCIETKLIIDKKERGRLLVYIKDTVKDYSKIHFLKEEKDLLDQIGIELNTIIEIQEKREKQKWIDSKIRQTDRLNLLGEMTAGIAHELNTPLGNILGFAELLLKSENEPNKKNDLKKIIKSSIHARTIVKKLMFFSCEMPTQFQKIDINQLIRENLELLSLQVRENNIAVELNLDEKLEAIRIDSIQISQLMFNLVLNAINAMKNTENGKIEINSSQNENYVFLSIKDNGHGIDQKHHTKVFEPFFTTKAAGEGTGLGLAVVFGIVQSHGGKIEVISQKNEGAEFKIQFNK